MYESSPLGLPNSILNEAFLYSSSFFKVFIYYLLLVEYLAVPVLVATCKI